MNNKLYDNFETVRDVIYY